MLSKAPLGLVWVVMTGCISTIPVNIGQKTSLEKQLMGEVEPLSEEQILASSVRAPNGVGVGSQDDLQARAVAARRRQLFNRDDVDELKAAGCLAEGAAARLVARPCDKAAQPEVAALLARLGTQENADRDAIIDWAVSVDPVLTQSDRSQVVALYYRLLLDQARPGDWVQEKNGGWVRR
jgi:hypothetical protein